MLSRVSIALILSAILLGSCGFQPLYAKKNITENNSKLWAGVKIDTIAGRSGQIFKENLEDRLNPGIIPNPAYHLHVVLSNTITPIGIARDGTVSRYNIYLNSTYALYRNADDKKITTGSVTYVDSYTNLTNAYFSTYTSEEDAIKRGIIELSELYRQRLAVYLDAGATVNPPPELPKTDVGTPDNGFNPIPALNQPPAAPMPATILP